MAIKWIKLDTVDESSDIVSKRFIETVKNNPKTVLCLPTGNSPVETYKKIVQDHKDNGTSWKGVTTYNLDEYAGIKPEHPLSFRTFMKDNLFNHIDIDTDKNTRFPNPIGDLDKNATEYEAEIKKNGPFELTLLGIGVDGHIAYNEPNTPFDSKTHWQKLHPSTVELIEKEFKDELFVPHFGFTMGVDSIISNSKEIILIAFGESKRNALEILKSGKKNPAIVATALIGHPNVTIYTDLEI